MKKTETKLNLLNKYNWTDANINFNGNNPTSAKDCICIPIEEFNKMESDMENKIYDEYTPIYASDLKDEYKNDAFLGKGAEDLIVQSILLQKQLIIGRFHEMEDWRME